LTYRQHFLPPKKSRRTGRRSKSKAFLSLPSIDKSTYGFGRLIFTHAALKPLSIRQYSLRALPCLSKNQLCQNCKAPVSRQFLSDFRLSSMQMG
jgi:hypothetical protein